MRGKVGVVATTTVSRWITNAIVESQFEVRPSLAHSIRRNSASKAYTSGINITEVLSAAEWKVESIFSRYYYNQDYKSAYGRTVLDTA